MLRVLLDESEQIKPISRARESFLSSIGGDSKPSYERMALWHFWPKRNKRIRDILKRQFRVSYTYVYLLKFIRICIGMYLIFFVYFCVY